MKSMLSKGKGPWTALLRRYMKDIGPWSEGRVQRGKSSGTGRPTSACFKIPNICVSLNRLVFIVNLLVHFAEKILLLNPTNARGEYHDNGGLRVLSPETLMGVIVPAIHDFNHSIK